MNKFFLVLPAVFVISGCTTVGDLFSSDEKPLEGERISVLELQKELEPDDIALDAMGFIAPSPWKNEFWPQAGGYPNHSMQNLALSSDELKRVWRADIGQGGSDALPLTAQPIIVDGRAFTLDTDSTVTAFDIANGERIWSASVRPENEDDAVIGGGVSYSAGVLYVTNGYDEVLAMSPEDGTVKWRRPLPAPARAAPTIMNGRVFVTTLDNRVLAIDNETGTTMWEHAALAENAGLIGAASPAANHDIVVPVFSSGEIFALRIENGSVAWSDNLSAVRSYGGLSSLSDITGLPVLDKGLIFAVSFSGRLVAIDERTGSRAWQREVSSAHTPWVAGNHIFITSSDNKLVALGRDNGAIRWVTDLNRGEKDDSLWTGPVLAGGRLIVMNGKGRAAEYAPDTGELLREWSVGGPVTLSPIVAGGTLYVLIDNGTLAAYR